MMSVIATTSSYKLAEVAIWEWEVSILKFIHSSDLQIGKAFGYFEPETASILEDARQVEHFVFKLVDPVRIAEARSILADGRSSRRGVNGKIAPTKGLLVSVVLEVGSRSHGDRIDPAAESPWIPAR